MKAIFTYHSIDRSGSPVSIAPEVFRGHLDWLASRNTPVVPLTELMALPDDAEAIALTFDDALASVAAEAAPMLVDYGFPATVFVVKRFRYNRSSAGMLWVSSKPKVSPSVRTVAATGD
jgi:peptidoglycan/xylan/chitin deacetylase (PgdA/CDA1 family)